MKMKTLVAAFVLFSSAAMATETTQETPASKEVEQSMGYFSIGLGPFPLPLPNFAFGYRNQTGHHGYDVSLQAATVVVATQIKMNALYHHYFKPNLESQFYAGGGLGVSALVGGHNVVTMVDGHNVVAISPEIVFGKQYRNKTNDTRFIQAQISFPTVDIGRVHGYYSHDNVLWFPLMVVSYGMGF
ncbi:MAG: hypothetical protein HW387_527 [Parachlamydiales bacterium]|nr:hypothetical protein [Parachlamydiales bacterium]